jgi:hypothetical protein
MKKFELVIGGGGGMVCELHAHLAPIRAATTER